jgi:hypothetical protein
VSWMFEFSLGVGLLVFESQFWLLISVEVVFLLL